MTNKLFDVYYYIFQCLDKLKSSNKYDINDAIDIKFNQYRFNITY